MDLLIESISMPIIIRFSIILKSTIWFQWQLETKADLFDSFNWRQHKSPIWCQHHNLFRLFCDCMPQVTKANGTNLLHGRHFNATHYICKVFFFLDAYNSILLRLFGWLSFFFKNIFSFLSFVFINMYSHGCWNYGKVNVIFARYREKWSRAMECEAKRSHHHQLSCCCRHRRAHRCYKNFCQSWSKMRFFFRSYFWLCRVECVCVVFSGPLGTMKNHGVGW